MVQVAGLVIITPRRADNSPQPGGPLQCAEAQYSNSIPEWGPRTSGLHRARKGMSSNLISLTLDFQAALFAQP